MSLRYDFKDIDESHSFAIGAPVCIDSIAKVEQLLEWNDCPVLRNHSHLRLFVSRTQFHTNPIFARCWFTLASSSATRLAICGMGVS